MKIKTILDTIVSSVLLTTGTLLMLGELEQFDVLVFLTIKVLGIVFLLVGVIAFPFTFNINATKQEALDNLINVFFIIAFVTVITIYAINL